MALSKKPTRLTRRRVEKHFNLPSLAKQSFKEECDVNQIMKKFKKTGLVDHLNTHKGQYGNFIGASDYHTSLNQILAAQESFQTIPSEIRAKFDNDAGQFLEFTQDPENYQEMIKMGLALEGTTEPPDVPHKEAGTPLAAEDLKASATPAPAE